MTPADAQERDQAEALAAARKEATEGLADVDRGDPGGEQAADASAHGIRLEVVDLPEAKRGFVLLSRRWVTDRGVAWVARFRRLARDYDRLAETVAGLRLVAFACRMAHRLTTVVAQGP